MELQFTVRAYGRRSDDKQTISPFQQESACKDAFALFQRVKQDWSKAVWGGFFCEEPMTRTSMFHRRPIGSAIIAVSKPNDVILVSNYDRIFADVVDVCDTLTLIEQRKFRILVLDMDIPLDNDLGQGVFKILAIVKELEVKAIRRRCKESAIYRVAQGMPQGRHAIGWRTVAFKHNGAIRHSFIPHEQHRAVAQQVLDIRIKEELSYNDLYQALNERKIPYPNATRWNHTAAFKWSCAAARGFPLPNGSHTAAPVPADAEPFDAVLPDD